MGYELNIIRETDPPIQLQEWNEYVENDNELEIVDVVEGKSLVTGSEIKTPLEKAARYKDERAIFIFSTDYNMISVVNPSQKTVDKMIKIANTLGAIVQGEEGELYNSLSNPEIFQDYEFVRVEKPKKWFEFWKN
ncbi:hypothetical protein [Aquimarina sediminis]|uniref:hypothetical protein n=1 Tax=Aquimarina sediminis TaxID=2070536 RepID=UPI000CA08B0E|nr:hypothetical protein [Aquimarina sediminis]